MAFKVHSIDVGENVAPGTEKIRTPGEINPAARENRVREGVMLQSLTASQLIDRQTGFDARVSYATAIGWFNEPEKISAIGSYAGLRGELIKPSGQDGVNVRVDGTGEIVEGDTELSLFAGTQFHPDAVIEFSADTHADIEQMLDAIVGPRLNGVWVRVMTDDGITADRSVPGCAKIDGEYPPFASLPSLQVKFTPEGLTGQRVHEGYYIRRFAPDSERAGIDTRDGVFYGGKPHADPQVGFAHLHTTIAGLSSDNIHIHNRRVKAMSAALPETDIPTPSIGGHTLDLAPVRQARAEIMFLDQAFVMEANPDLSARGRAMFRPMNGNASMPSDAEINHDKAAFKLDI